MIQQILSEARHLLQPFNPPLVDRFGHSHYANIMQRYSMSAPALFDCFCIECCYVSNYIGDLRHQRQFLVCLGLAMAGQVTANSTTLQLLPTQHPSTTTIVTVLQPHFPPHTVQHGYWLYR
jgi:hypothetical protein